MGLAGVAFDGSMWVTATSSVALVVASGSCVAAGAWLVAKRVAQGGIDVGPATQPGAATQTARRIQPLQKSSSQQGSSVQPPPRAESVDEVL